MIPSEDDVLYGFTFVARRRGIANAPNETIISVALDEAKRLVRGLDEEPAAVFFAFARRARAFPGAWHAMTLLLARNVASAQGLMIQAREPEFKSLCMDIAERRADFPAVLAWFLARQRSRSR